MSVIPDSEFGARVRRRLRDEHLIWLTTMSDDGTPQPNPVWFLWEEPADSALVYTGTHAVRLNHVAVRPRVAMNLQAAADGDDVVVIAGVAEQALDEPAPGEHAGYLAKYADAIRGIGSDPDKFSRDYSVALRVVFTKVRGF